MAPAWPLCEEGYFGEERVRVRFPHTPYKPKVVEWQKKETSREKESSRGMVPEDRVKITSFSWPPTPDQPRTQLLPSLQPASSLPFSPLLTTPPVVFGQL